MTRSAAARCTSTTDGSGNDAVVNLDRSRQRTILEPLDINTINAKKFLRLPEIQLTELAKDSSIANRKGHTNLQFLRVISNGRSKNQSQIRYYKAKDASEK